MHKKSAGERSRKLVRARMQPPTKAGETKKCARSFDCLFSSAVCREARIDGGGAHTLFLRSHICRRRRDRNVDGARGAGRGGGDARRSRARPAGAASDGKKAAQPRLLTADEHILRYPSAASNLRRNFAGHCAPRSLKKGASAAARSLCATRVR